MGPILTRLIPDSKVFEIGGFADTSIHFSKGAAGGPSGDGSREEEAGGGGMDVEEVREVKEAEEVEETKREIRNTKLGSNARKTSVKMELKKQPGHSAEGPRDPGLSCPPPQ
jgi:hypothetical protein